VYKLTVLYPTAADPEAFKAYYVETHLPLTAKMPGIKRINYSFDLVSLGGEPAPFCMFEAWFEDGPTFGASSQSPEGQAVVADIANFASGPPTVFHGPVAEQ
jgi:uncharacterized protein (TIGR02118 family)